MAKFIGRRINVGIAKEATRGTPANPAFWIPQTSISLDDKVEKVDEKSAMGQIADTDSSVVTGKYAEGEIEGEIRDKALGLILTGVMGASPTTTGASPYMHTYTLADASNQHQSLSILKQDPNGASMFALAMVDSFEISVEPLGIVTYKVGFTSKGSQDWTSQTPSFTSLGEKFLHQHLQFKVADTISGLTAASVLSLKALTFKVNKNSVRDNVMGTLQPEDILNAQISVEGSLTLNYEDRVWRNYMLDGTYKAMEIKFYKDANSSLTIQLPRVSFNSWKPASNLDDIITQDIDFKAHYDAANAQRVIHTVVLVNQQASGQY